MATPKVSKPKSKAEKPDPQLVATREFTEMLKEKYDEIVNQVNVHGHAIRAKADRTEQKVDSMLSHLVLLRYTAVVVSLIGGLAIAGLISIIF